MSRPPGLQLFRNSRHFEHLQDGGHKAGDVSCNNFTSKIPGHPFLIESYVVASTMWLFLHICHEVIAKPELQSALVLFVARGMEVELLNSLGQGHVSTLIVAMIWDLLL